MPRFVDQFGMTEWRNVLRMRDDAPLVEMIGVSKTYEVLSGNIQALRDVFLRLEQGEFSAIVGPSGSGKSTMIHIMAGLSNPTAGRVLFKGLNLHLAEESVQRLVREEFIGVVPQDVNLIRYLNARENVELPMDMMGIGRRDRRDRAVELLAEVGLGERENHLPSEMSGGELQRVAIARALALNPALVLADEPTANLDHTTAEKVVDLMAEECREMGRTFLFVTHDPLVTERCDRVLSIRDGLLVDRTTPVAGEVTIEPLSYFTQALFDGLKSTFLQHLLNRPIDQGERFSILDTPFEVGAPGLHEARFSISSKTELRYIEGISNG